MRMGFLCYRKLDIGAQTGLQFLRGIVLAILSHGLVSSACGHDVGEQIGLLGSCHKITHRLVSSDCGHYIGEEIGFFCSKL